MEVRELLGKAIGSDEVLRFMERAGTPPTLDSFGDTQYLEFRALGVCLCTEVPRTEVSTIFLYYEEDEGYGTYAGEPPFGIAASHDRAVVRERLGAPSKSGEGQTIDGVGPKGPWDRYDFPKYCIHFQYALSGRGIVLVTLMSAAPEGKWA